MSDRLMVVLRVLVLGSLLAGVVAQWRSGRLSPREKRALLVIIGVTTAIVGAVVLFVVL